MWLHKYARPKACRFMYAFYSRGSNLALILEMMGNFWGIFNGKMACLDLYFAFTRESSPGSKQRRGYRRISLWARKPASHARDINSLVTNWRQSMRNTCSVDSPVSWLRDYVASSRIGKGRQKVNDTRETPNFP